MTIGISRWKYMFASLSVVNTGPCVTPCSAWLYMLMICVGGCLEPSHLMSIIMKSISTPKSVLNVMSIDPCLDLVVGHDSGLFMFLDCVGGQYNLPSLEGHTNAPIPPQFLNQHDVVC